MTKINKEPITCAWCGKTHLIYRGELRRKLKLGSTNFFCSASCACSYGNEIYGRNSVAVERECPTCHQKFMSSTRRRSAIFCSRACASRGSVTDYRRKRARAIGRANAKFMNSTEARAASLRSREGWKYEALRGFLEKHKIPHIFEMPLGNFVFDLALTKLRVLVEFDGSYHTWEGQQEVDREKTKVASAVGWRVVRIPAEENSVIRPSSLRAVVTM